MAEKKMQLEDWLDDLCVRFIINLPSEDLSSVARICFQVEEAQWFYEDFIRPLDPTLPSMSLRSFCLRIFQHCPLLASFSVENHMRAFEEFLQYKTRVPVRGAILLNEAMDSTVLVKGWKKGANWSFPRGKINKDEDDLVCAIREVEEETGLDIREAGLVPKDDEVKYIEITMREQQIRLYVFRNVPMDTVFQPKTRKEISQIQWYRLSELPAFRKKGNNHHDDAAASSNANKFYMVAPFLVPLKKWVLQQRKKDEARAASQPHYLSAQAIQEEPLTEDDIGTQTEAAAETSSATPAIETLEGATHELQRLLKVQPPTQGLQLNPSASGEGNCDKAGALMSILQSKASAPQPQQFAPLIGDAQNPRTPVDLTYTNAPQPHTPHHHHPTQRLPPDDIQQPPHCPLAPQFSQGIPLNYQAHVPLPGQMAPRNHNLARAHIQNLPYGVSGPQPRQEPPLLHPQPLPPQVQQSLLTRGILPTPHLPEAAGIASVDGTFSRELNDVRGLSYQQQRSSNLPPPQLTSHHMSLLNALKSETIRTTEPHQAPAPTTRGSGTSQPSTSFNIPTRQHLMAQGPPSGGVESLQAPLAAMAKPVFPDGSWATTANPQPSTDKHRSALLDMFKKQGPLPPPSSEALIRAAKPDYERMARVEAAKVSAKPQSSAEAIAAASQLNGGPAVMNPELNLPYRALQILSRPKQSENSPIDNASSEHGSPASVQKDTKHMISPSMAYSLGQSSSLPQAGSIPKTVLGHLPPLPQSVNVPYNHPQYQTMSGPQHGSAFPAAGVLHHRQESNPEQRQKLLSLFGKPQASPTGLSADEKGKLKESNIFQQPRSRVSSLASGSGEGIPTTSSKSRRGSQTPISPADRDFLLNFLQSVSNQAP